MSNADLELARAIIAAKIMHIIDAHKLSTRDTGELTAVSHAEFARIPHHIRDTQLCCITLDRMIAILGKLDEEIEVSVSFRKQPQFSGNPKIARSSRKPNQSIRPLITALRPQA